jgi:hypothetical protein
MSNLAEVIAPDEGRSYDIEAANHDANKLAQINRKARKATALIDQDIAEAEAELQRLMERKKEILEPMETEMSRLKSNLMAYHSGLLASGIDEKTIKLSGATLKSQKNPQGYIKDDDTLLEWAQSNAAEYVKVAASVAWGELKKQLVVVGGKVMLKETGEVVEGIEPKPIETNFSVEVL